MKALIFNSGLGRRMKGLTENRHKSMVTLKNGESIFERQVRLLSEGGITEFVVTTGPFEEQFIEVASKDAYKNLTFHFVNNPIYDKTNYIYSFYLARHLLDDDFLLLHGDLVFDAEIVPYVINAPYPSTCMINKELPLPDKDFKGRITTDGRLSEVSINIFDSDCYTFQPLYKLDKATLAAWVESVVDFIENQNNSSVYAENALNAISDKLDIRPISYHEHFLEEIDNEDDYVRVREGIELFDYRQQKIKGSLSELKEAISSWNIKKPLVVIGKFMLNSNVKKYLEDISEPIFFSGFLPNPTYAQITDALEIFKSNGCDALISVGGGSAIDVAKAVKYFSAMENGEERYVNLKHVAIPTTAGTGSESTKYSVYYDGGEKQSLSHDMLLPELALLLPELLSSLPARQRNATLLDALCQATEAIWAQNSTDEAKAYSKQSIELILSSYEKYMAGDESANAAIMQASNLAGRAINITATTAAHALSYKLTSKFGISHGMAVALCMLPVWSFYNESPRLSEKDKNDALWLASSYGVSDVFSALEKFKSVLVALSAIFDVEATKEELCDMVDNANVERLKNFPVPLSKDDVRKIYCAFVKVKA